MDDVFLVPGVLYLKVKKVTGFLFMGMIQEDKRGRRSRAIVSFGRTYVGTLSDIRVISDIGLDLISEPPISKQKRAESDIISDIGINFYPIFERKYSTFTSCKRNWSFLATCKQVFFERSRLKRGWGCYISFGSNFTRMVQSPCLCSPPHPTLGCYWLLL